MVRISSRATTLHKKVFPRFWLGFVGFFWITSLMTGTAWHQPLFLFGPLALGAFGYLLMKILVGDLVDEVYDAGDHLVVRNRSEEDVIALQNIKNVSASTFINPPRITLRLVHAAKFGSDITFVPVTMWTLNPFAKHQIAEDLKFRVNQARRTA